MFLHHVRTRVDGRSNYFCIFTLSSTPDFGPRACPVLELQQQAPPARDAATPPARALHKLARRRPDDRWRHRSSAARRDAGQQGDVGPSGSGAGASQHRGDAATPPARALHKLARRRPDDRWRHRTCGTTSLVTRQVLVRKACSASTSLKGACSEISNFEIQSRVIW